MQSMFVVSWTQSRNDLRLIKRAQCVNLIRRIGVHLVSFYLRTCVVLPRLCFAKFADVLSYYSTDLMHLSLT